MGRHCAVRRVRKGRRGTPRVGGMRWTMRRTRRANRVRPHSLGLIIGFVSHRPVGAGRARSWQWHHGVSAVMKWRRPRRRGIFIVRSPSD